MGKFAISVVVMFIMSMALGFLVHATLLHADYARLTGSIFRPESDAQGYFGYMLFAHLLMGIGLTWIYRMGHEAGKGVISQGLRFGMAIAVVSTIPTYLIYYAVQRLPSDLVAQQIIFDTISMLLLGVLVAWLNKTP